MVFSSPIFLFLFLPLVLLATAMAGSLRGKNAVLTVASLLFYVWGELGYVLVMLSSILFNYLCAHWLERSRGLPGHRTALMLTVVVNIGLLVFFKYANFIVDNLSGALIRAGLEPLQLDPVHLPIGISFFTFHALSYTIDVSRGKARAHPKLGTIALYIALFPQLVAGPIIRYADVSEQFDDRRVTLERFASGSRRFIIGLAKKLLIADTVARVSTAMLAIPDGHLSASAAWLGMIAFSIQLYFDFSGYSDMAIGLGRMFGFTFLENFNLPYIAGSIREFWTRWHISLSTWFRDYVYIPLGGNRGGSSRTYFNLLVVFFLTGLWHGASWNFVVWGMYHGAFMVIERLGLGKLLDRLPRPLAMLYTVPVVVIGWVFFEITDITHAWHVVLVMLGLGPTPDGLFDIRPVLSTDVWVALILGAFFSTPLPAWTFERLQRSWSRLGSATLHSVWTLVDGLGHVALLVLCMMHMAANTFTPFLYFRF